MTAKQYKAFEQAFREYDAVPNCKWIWWGLAACVAVALAIVYGAGLLLVYLIK